MGQMILRMVLGAVIDLIFGRISQWWAQKQAQYYAAQAQVNQQKFDSLQQGQAEQEKLNQAAEETRIAAESAQTWQQQVDAMINRRNVMRGLKERKARLCVKS